MLDLSMYNTRHAIVAQHCNYIWNTVYIMKWYIWYGTFASFLVPIECESHEKV